MAYESLIGWRYLYRGRRSLSVILGLALSMLLALGGATWFLTTGQPSAVGVAILMLGTTSTLFFALLCLFSVFTTVSVCGVVLGVAALTVVFGVTSGFQAQFREKVLGVNAHVLVMKTTQGFSNYRDVEELARKLPHVTAVQPFLYVEMLITRGKGSSPAIAMKGVDPDRIVTVLDLPKHMIAGSVERLKEHPVGAPPPIIIGRELASKLDAKEGDIVTLVSPLSGIDVRNFTATGRPPKTRKFQIQGIFYSGFDEYDRRLTYVDIKEAQDFLEQGDVVMGVEMKLDDVTQAGAVAHTLDARLGGDPYVVMDWRELNRNLFTALTLQKVALLIILTLIIVVAAFNMVAALTMMVIDKTKEVAIIKSMGASAGGVARIFQVVGLTIGGVGTLFGLGLGWLACTVVGRYGYPLDPKVYLIDRLPIAVNPLEIVLVGIITMVICALATLFPAMKAAALRPVDGLRYE
jgi:lipoprotein-releasing system permease protein